jgi:hypothetical protein
MDTHKFPRPWHRDSMLGYTPEWQTCEVCLRKTHCLESRLLECPGKPPPEGPESQTTTEPSAGAVEAANEWFHYAYGPTNILVCRLTEIIDRLAVRPAVDGAISRTSDVVHEIYKDRLAAAEAERKHAVMDGLKTVTALMESEAERDRLLILIRDTVHWVQQGTLSDNDELFGELRAALGEKGE